MASLQADMLHAATQIQEKEGLAEQLRAEVASLEERVRVACQEAAENAAELEKGAHEARLALEATLQLLAREEAVAQTLPAGQDTLPLPLCEQFLRVQDTKWTGRAEGAEATADAPLSAEVPDTPSPGGLQEEADRRATRLAHVIRWMAASSSSRLLPLSRPVLTPRSHRSGEKAVFKSPLLFHYIIILYVLYYHCVSNMYFLLPAGADYHSVLNKMSIPAKRNNLSFSEHERAGHPACPGHDGASTWPPVLPRRNL
ncbi:uncharacterized protein PHA67_000236 isoform 1-T1 [Liasis olivaceus]